MNSQFNTKLALNEASSLQKSGLITHAIDIYINILKNNSTNFEANFEIGNCYEKIKNYNKALLHLKKAINLNDKCYKCHYSMAKIYDKLSKFEFSLFHLKKVIKIRPDFHDILFSIAQCYRKMADEENMLDYINKTLEKIPEHPGANHFLASLNKEIRSQYSAEYTEDLFDRYADHFEDHLVISLKYKVPFIIKDKLKSLNLSKNSKVLDLGCGTGLLGRTIIEEYPNIVGVDISTNMIKETRKKEIYSELYISDIYEFLLQNDKKFDLIIAADVFIYIGDIETIFFELKKCLTSNGYFIFTIELSSEINIKNFQLAKTGRFSHDIDYIESLCNNIGLEIVEKEEVILREENKIGQKGVIFVLKPLDFKENA